jgi:ribosomal subunit interface protein
MDTHLTGTGMALTAEIRAHFAKQAKKIGKLVHDPAGRLEVELEHLTERKTDDEFRAELMLKAPGLELRSEATAISLYGAIDESIEQLLTELRKVKGKRLNMVRRQAHRFKEFFRGFYGASS